MAVLKGKTALSREICSYKNTTRNLPATVYRCKRVCLSGGTTSTTSATTTYYHHLLLLRSTTTTTTNKNSNNKHGRFNGGVLLLQVKWMVGSTKTQSFWHFGFIWVSCILSLLWHLAPSCRWLNRRKHPYAWYYLFEKTLQIPVFELGSKIVFSVSTAFYTAKTLKIIRREFWSIKFCSVFLQPNMEGAFFDRVEDCIENRLLDTQNNQKILWRIGRKSVCDSFQRYSCLLVFVCVVPWCGGLAAERHEY